MKHAATPGRGRYAVERTLGRGGMATVYLAHDTVLGRPVALKVLAEHLADDESFRARFLREARLAARIAHPNVVQVYDAGGDEAGLFIAMEYVDGESLAEELARRGRLSAGEVVDLGRQLAAALAAAHAAGLVHRDVKPPNVLRSRDGTVKLGDFGIAHSHDSTALTAHGSVLGTAAYLSPEQARAEPVTGAADLYALGVVLYEALTGRWPHEGVRASRSSCCGASARPSRLRASSWRMCRPRSTRRSCVASPCGPTTGPPRRRRSRRSSAAAMPEAATRPLPLATATAATRVMRGVPLRSRRPPPRGARGRGCAGDRRRGRRHRDDGVEPERPGLPRRRCARSRRRASPLGAIDPNASRRPATAHCPRRMSRSTRSTSPTRKKQHGPHGHGPKHRK